MGGVVGLLTRARRGGTAAIVLVVFLTLVGATYQGVATALEQSAFPRPGGLVPVGDHQLHLHCTGNGLPTVILEAPAAAPSAAWAGVQERVAESTRVCSYDRAGLGWSEAGPRPFDPGRVPEELRTLLDAAGQPGPFVVVGHGLGAAFARLYAARPDAEAVALIEVVPARIGQTDSHGWVVPASPWLARTGLLRAGRILSREADGLEGTAGDAVRAFLNRPDHLTRAAAELRKWDDAVRMARGTPLRADMPARVVDLPARDRIDFLTDPAHADRVAAAIEDAVRTSRESLPVP
jgi:pimeloyl-ACP methyl ester carboxylesterase